MRLTVTMSGTPAELGMIGNDDAGTEATIAAMQAVIDHAVSDSRTRSLIVAALPPAPATAKLAARQLYRWARQHVTFQKDPEGVELLRHPSDLLRSAVGVGEAWGDCDDLAMLGCTILAVWGFRPVLITVSRGPAPSKFQHVFFGIRTGEGLKRSDILPLDPQEKTPLGAWPDRIGRTRFWSVSVTPV